MKFAFLDIETIPLKIENEDIREYLMDHKINKEMRTFDPNYSKIVCICLKFSDEECKVFFNEDEKVLLQEFWSFVNENKSDTVFVTHNGYSFDVPIINLRTIVNGLNIPFDFNVNKWNMDKSNHFDIMLFFSNLGNFTNLPLNILAKMHNIEVKETITGREIEKYFNEKDFDKIKGRCRNDVFLLENVFNKLCVNYRRSKF
ncbi:hypothetical protein CL617_00450 [archaeon]|nr:hypothetical protein [archaeon]|tara:strand:- start:2809 stop:3411 length:603 start_codon:yes stop_codon:yes gene_type:complete